MIAVICLAIAAALLFWPEPKPEPRPAPKRAQKKPPSDDAKSPLRMRSPKNVAKK